MQNKISKKYYVVLIDIKDSTKVLDRDALTKKMSTLLVEINARYSADYHAPFEITKGDEVAAVLTSINNLLNILLYFHDTLYPVEFRAVMEYNVLSAGLDTKRSAIIDGPAFYNANKTLLGIKNTQKYFNFNSGRQELDDAVSALMNVILWRLNDLTSSQRDILRLYQKERHQKKVAQILKISQQYIQKTLDRCKWQIFDGSEAALQTLLSVIDAYNKKKENRE